VTVGAVCEKAHNIAWACVFGCIGKLIFNEIHRCKYIRNLFFLQETEVLGLPGGINRLLEKSGTDRRAK